MALIGHPLAGDALYGGGQRQRRGLNSCASAALATLGRQALHAFLIGFIHPATSRRHVFEISLSNDIKGLIDCLKIT
jgi:23S rRNA pseudouridine1911/1915/1917 synthase